MKPCDNCNSQVIIIKQGNSYVAECSYCGQPADYYVGVDLTEELDEDDE